MVIARSAHQVRVRDEYPAFAFDRTNGGVVELFGQRFVTAVPRQQVSRRVCQAQTGAAGQLT